MSKLKTLVSTRMIKLGAAATALAVFGLATAPFASATAISFYNDASAPSGTARFTVGCGSSNGDCTGLLQAVSGTNPLAWSSSVGEALIGPLKANPASETTFVNGLLGKNLTASSGNIEPNNKNSFEFQFSGDYFLIKVGNGPTGQGYALLQNLDGNLDLFFTHPKGGQAGGLSHYITFGTGSAPTPVPEPAALGMFGVGVLLIGGFLGLRRRYH